MSCHEHGYPWPSLATSPYHSSLLAGLQGYIPYTRMLRAILNRSWWQHPTRHQLYGHLPPITKTIQVRRSRHTGHCWRSKDKLISDVLLWTPAYGQAKAGWPAQTYIQQLCEDMGCMYVRAGRPAFAWPYVGVHRSTSLTSLSLLLQQCPVCLKIV